MKPEPTDLQVQVFTGRLIVAVHAAYGLAGKPAAAPAVDWVLGIRLTLKALLSQMKQLFRC